MTFGDSPGRLSRGDGCMPYCSVQARGGAGSGTLDNTHYDSSPIKLITWTSSISYEETRSQKPEPEGWVLSPESSPSRIHSSKASSCRRLKCDHKRCFCLRHPYHSTFLSGVAISLSISFPGKARRYLRKTIPMLLEVREPCSRRVSLQLHCHPIRGMMA